LARLHKVAKEITATTAANCGGWKVETLLKLIAVVWQWVRTAILPKKSLKGRQHQTNPCCTNKAGLELLAGMIDID